MCSLIPRPVSEFWIMEVFVTLEKGARALDLFTDSVERVLEPRVFLEVWFGWEIAFVGRENVKKISKKTNKICYCLWGKLRISPPPCKGPEKSAIVSGAYEYICGPHHYLLIVYNHR